MKIIEVNPSVRALVEKNGGHCPCSTEKTKDTLCPCKAFLERPKLGICHYGRYEKTEV